MVEVSLTVGKLDASLALLLTKDHHLIEFPTILLPNGVKAGSIVKIKCDQDFETEKEEEKQFGLIQDEILNTFGKNLPKNPVLKPKNITQTSCVLEWESLNLGTANLKNLFLYKDGKKLGSIPQPLTNKTTKLSGLPIDQTFKFQLKLDTTAGVYLSDVIEVTTHKMTNLSGITVCLGDITPNDQFTIDDIQETLKNIGAHYPAQDKVKVDTTHFICTKENQQNPECVKAGDMNIPIIRPEWLKACERDSRIVGVRDYYVSDCVLPDIFAKNFWQKKEPESIPEPSEKPPVPEKSTDGPESDMAAAVENTTANADTTQQIHEIKLQEKEDLPDLPERMEEGSESTRIEISEPEKNEEPDIKDETGVVKDKPEAPKEEPEVPKEEPEAPKEEPDVPKEPEAPKDEPEAPKDEPEAPKDEPEAPKDEPQPPITDNAKEKAETPEVDDNEGDENKNNENNEGDQNQTSPKKKNNKKKNNKKKNKK